MIFSQLVLNWFHQYGRKNLPWQKNNTVYHTWISEIMLQQTKVNTVIPYFKKFILIFPNIQTLANSSLDQVMYIWSGMGFYNRAKNLHRTANIIMKQYNGKFPENFYTIIQFPGIGRTTAGAILSLSFKFYFSILDSNIKRILLRYYAIEGIINNKKIEIKLWKMIELITPIHNTDKFNQAMMDIGALICIPINPKCTICPLNKLCISYKTLTYTKYPTKNKKKNIEKQFWCIVIQYKHYILLELCKINNLWSNLFILPTFTKEINILSWYKENQLIDTKKIPLKPSHHKISNFLLTLHTTLITIESKKKIIKKEKNIWYNLIKPQQIGIPKPIMIILKNLHNINNKNGKN
ncbi:Adenine DNA glycosylase [Buchnera aphidicola (Eriosoma lanigerum)]|uniref:A/G-specific adenine glycosylase n=1 Tax=Buchnera aphidicola TaxID=9 RepID=UPI003463C738